MSWSPGQQAMLSAMGYTLYRQANAPGTAAPRVPARAGARPDGMPERLWDALVRAAGGYDPSPLLPPAEQLRAGAAAKRALWPALRALRRGG
jgi:hypothetical protein